MTDTLTDSIRSTATSLLTLQFPPPHATTPEPQRPNEKLAIESALRKRVTRIAEDDMSDLESMLACQAQLLHEIFMDSTRKYATNTMAEHSRLFSGVALKSQNYCRMTIAALSALKTTEQDAALLKKSRNELNRKDPHAALDRGKKTTPTGADPWLAAMEEQLWAEQFKR